MIWLSIPLLAPDFDAEHFEFDRDYEHRGMMRHRLPTQRPSSIVSVPRFMSACTSIPFRP
jgi:hypothetical protein